MVDEKKILPWRHTNIVYLQNKIPNFKKILRKDFLDILRHTDRSNDKIQITILLSLYR